MECGTLLTEKYLEKEGLVPYCPNCQEYRFPVFSVAVSMIVRNKKDEVLLIKQYDKESYVLVAGYINIFENAEQTVIREVKEEIGLDVVALHFSASEYYEPTQTLMLNFECLVLEDDLSHTNDEVDEARWFSKEEALKQMKPNTLTKRFYMTWYKRMEKSHCT